MLVLNRRSFAVLGAGSLCARAASAADAPVAVRGGGSSFVSGVMTRWTASAKAKGMTVDYAVLGAGASQNRILAGDIDFAAGELVMTDEKLALADLMQVPVAFGAMAFAVNIDGMADGQLKLNPRLLGGIFSGALKKWNDPDIAAANPGLSLPDLDIHPISLGDTNGAVFSTSTTLLRYLMAYNPDWQTRFQGKRLGTRWASGMLVPTSAAMVPLLQSHPGSIGYMSLGAALSTRLPRVMLPNKGGEMVLPSPESLRVAVSRIEWQGLVVSSVDLPAAGVWPFVLCSYAVISRAAEKQARNDAVRAFLRYALQDCDGDVVAAGGAPLPADAKAKVLALLA
jgi:phosphate transport system substrate-binding protein